MEKLKEWFLKSRTNIEKNVKEYGAFGATILGFFLLPYILRWIDPTTAAFDPGVLQTAFVVVVLFAFYQLATWSIIKNIWKPIGDYMKSGLFTHAFKDLDQRTKVLISLGAYFLIFTLMVLLTIAVI